MTKLKILSTLACLAFVAAPVSVQAEDAPKVSYSKKKSGGVPFSQKDDTTAAAEETTVDPSEIEPAAGASDAVEEKDETNVAEDMKLPRK